MLLRNKDKQNLQAIFSTLNIPVEIWAYGSCVTGEAHEGSDLDLVIRSHNLQKLPIDVLLNLKKKIQQSNIPIVVELFDWARLPESFHRNIEAQRKVLFGNLSMAVNEPQSQYKGLNPDSGDLHNDRDAATKKKQDQNHPKDHRTDQ